MRPSSIVLRSTRRRGARNPKQSPIDPESVVRYLRMGDFEQAVRLFSRLPTSSRTSALHEAVILACAHVPDASAAAVVLKGMPRPTLAAYSHVVTAHCREHDPAAAISLLEAMSKNTDFKLDKRLLETVARHIRKNTNSARDAGDDGRNHAPLLQRLNRLVPSCGPLPNASGGTSVSLSTFDFFEDDGGDVEAWLASRSGSAHSAGTPVRRLRPPGLKQQTGTNDRGLSGILEANDRSSRREGLSSLLAVNANVEGSNVESNHESESSKRRAIDADLMSARGNYGRIERIRKLLSADPLLMHDVYVLSAFLSAYMSCGVAGMSQALKVLLSFLDGKVCDIERVLLDLQRSPASRSLLLTTATSVISGSAADSPLQALKTYRSLMTLPVQGYKSSLPLSGALLKVLRHAQLPVAQTLSYVNELRKGLIQFDEQSFSLALSAILNSVGSESQIWSESRKWLSTMQAAGIPLTIYTYNAFAYQLRHFNNPEMATSLLRDMARAEVKPTAYTYGLIFDSYVGRRGFGNKWSGSDHSTNRRLRVLTALDGHMAGSDVHHSRFSRLALARAYAHLGQISSAFENFDALWKHESEPNSFPCTPPPCGGQVSGADWSSLDSSDPFRMQHVYNLMLRSFAYTRCISADAPTAVFSTFQRMKDAAVPPNAETLEYLLSACDRVGQSARAIAYAKEFLAILEDDQNQFVLRPRGILHLLAALANVSTQDAWNSCEVILERSFSMNGGCREQFANEWDENLIESAVELAVLAFARSGNADVCARIIKLSGTEPEQWQMALQGQDFLRVRSVNRDKRLKEARQLERRCSNVSHNALIRGFSHREPTSSGSLTSEGISASRQSGSRISPGAASRAGDLSLIIPSDNDAFSPAT